MGVAHRLLYPTLNAAWGASLGAAGSRRPGDRRRGVRRDRHRAGQRPTLRGGVLVLGSAVAVYAGCALAVTAPGWVIAWVAAALAGFVTGLLRPLPK